jgi:MFS transporter, UMF1 family
VSTGLLVFVQEGNLVLGLGLLMVSNVGFAVGMSVYNAFLPELAKQNTVGRLSGYGWGFGYLGGMVALVVVFPLIRGGLAPENLLNYRLSFLVVALFFIFFSMPTFLWLRERATPQARPAHVALWRISVDRVRDTLTHLRRYRQLVRFFLSYIIYEDGVNTVFVFAAIFASAVLDMAVKDIFIFAVIANVASAFGAILLGRATDWVGTKRMIQLTLIGMMGVVVWASTVQTVTGFYGMGLVAGALLGANQSASRALLAQFTPPSSSAEFFGFFALMGKFAAILGPLLYGEIAGWTGSHRLAVLSIGVFFVVGLTLLWRVDPRAGIAEAAAPASTGGTKSALE